MPTSGNQSGPMGLETSGRNSLFPPMLAVEYAEAPSMDGCCPTQEQTLAELETAIAQDQVAVFLSLGGGWGEDAASGTSGVEIEKR